MPPVPPCNAVKLTAFHTVTGTSRQWANIFHMDYGALAPDQTQINALIADFDTHYDAFVTTFCHTSDTHIQTNAEDLSSSTGVVATTVPATPGGNAGTLAALNVAAVVSWRIARRYRGGKSRTYIGGLSDAQLSPPDQLSTVFAGNLQAAAVAFLAHYTNLSLSGLTWQLAVVSYRTANAPRVTPLVEDITAASVTAAIRSQRRRLG